MRLADLELTSSSNRFITIYPIGDLHCEKVLFNEARFTRYVNDIANDPHGMWVFVGDAIEGRTPDMQKYDPDVVGPTFKNSDYLFQVQEKLKRLFEPLRDTPGVVVKGNHDEYQKWSGISNYVAAVSGGHYLDGEGMFRLRVDLGGKTRVLLGYARHIIGGGRRPGSKMNQADDMGSIADADMYFAGHIHDHVNRVPTYYTIPRSGELRLVKVQKPRIVATSFLESRKEGVVDYSGRKGYPAVDEGLVVLDVDCENNRYTRREMRY